MEDRGTEEAWHECLSNQGDMLFVKFRYYSESGRVKILEFSVVYHIISKGKKVSEVIRYDCSEKESLHVHEYWHDPPEKRFINADYDFETLEGLIKSVKKNWQEYKSRFINK